LLRLTHWDYLLRLTLSVASFYLVVATNFRVASNANLFATSGTFLPIGSKVITLRAVAKVFR
jgi:hypothetical protein